MSVAVSIPPDSVGAWPHSYVCVGCRRECRLGRAALRANRTTLPFALHRCTACGLVQRQPRTSAAINDAQYDGTYYVFHEDEPLRWARAAQQYAVHLRALESRHARRLLDIGCAAGHLSALARYRGWRVTGLDVSADAVSRAVAQFGIDARAGALSLHLATLPTFDVVFLGDVIEHVDDPIAFLRDVRAALSPGGVVCIDTPNWGGFWRRVGGRRWIGLNRYHVNLFEAASLSRLLVSTGFQDVRCGSYTHYRYAAPAARPEVAAWIDALPAALAWRVRSCLARAGRFCAWHALRDAPPAGVEAAGRCVAELCRNDGAASASLLHDNLVSAARRA